MITLDEAYEVIRFLAGGLVITGLDLDINNEEAQEVFRENAKRMLARGDLLMELTRPEIPESINRVLAAAFGLNLVYGMTDDD